MAPPDGESCTVLAADGPSSVGDSTTIGHCASASPPPIVLDGEEGESSSVAGQETEKDPRKIARRYQLELCKKALEENVIVYLGTGCGKTHIAVLLIYEMRHLIRRPQMSVCIFLAPTQALVNQQAKVIEDSVGLKVGIYRGGSSHLKSHHGWQKELEENEVLVMTPQILLYNLSHSFIRMDSIALLIFDECHHAQDTSSHPYAQIMRVFYKAHNGKLPRIFGMTASPIVGKGASNQGNLPKTINSLESLLDAKVYSVEDKEELECFVASPVVKVYLYGPVSSGTSSVYGAYTCKLDEIRHQSIMELRKKADTRHSLQSLRSAKKALCRNHDNVIFCLENLGLWGAFQACQALLSAEQSERNSYLEAEESITDVAVCDRYLAQVADVIRAECGVDSTSCSETLREPYFSKKFLCLIEILSNFRLQPNMKCIVFVNRIIVASTLSYILQNLEFLESWKCDFLVGVHSGLRSMSRKTMNNKLENFRTGQLNLLVATKVGEEGLDIQTCCLVIRFDLPETVASFIQSRGRARMPQSEYAFLVDRGNQKELDLIENFQKNEYRMNMEITGRTSDDTFVSLEERVYKVDASGASVSSGYSISLLHHYCSKLPHDEFFDPKPKFDYFDDSEGIVCYLSLPCNAPIYQIVSAPQSSTEAAKKDACLKAIERLHKIGALTDFLLPEQEGIAEEAGAVSSEAGAASSDPGIDEDDGSRVELHEMRVSALLKESWSNFENSVLLNSYYIEFCPVPVDRIYRKFGLFVKAPLPEDAMRMDLDLHLARGRSVKTKLIKSGLSEFSKDEVVQAQMFQEMFLKVILDRTEFVQEYVPLGKNPFCQSSPSFYLLLPVILHGCQNRMTIEWEVIRRCLSSPIFRNPASDLHKEALPLDPHLQLSNGRKCISDIENSLVYAPFRKTFYFIANVVPEKNGYSPHKGLSSPSHVEHLFQTFGIHLKYPEQPLLNAKPLFKLRNLLHSRKQENSESQELDEYFIGLAPELCELKIIGFSKDIGSSISLLPSIMHRLGNLLVAIELKNLLSASFAEGSEVAVDRVLEAITTENCQERISLERLEILGDAFLKFAVGRYLFLLHDKLDEGELTRRRSNIVSNSNLFKLAIRRNLQGYIRDQPLDPCLFYALGRPCPTICTKESEGAIHSQPKSQATGQTSFNEVRCSKVHHWLQKKTVADVVEALVGAFIVDSGFKAATAFLRWMGIKVNFEASQVTKICQASRSYLLLVSSMDMPSLENLLGYQFLHKGLLLQAFIHPSYNKGGGCYQRLEFLGDAVLDYLMTSYLYSVYPKLKPGHLTDLRSASVNNRAFADVAIDRTFHEFLICDSSSLLECVNDYVNFAKTPAQERVLREAPKCPKVLGDLVESCMGAILLDTGFNLSSIWRIMLSVLDPAMNFSKVQLDPVRELQEICQGHNFKLQFPETKKGKFFSVDAKVSGKDVCLVASAINLNKKEAKKLASEKLLPKLKDQGYPLKYNSLEELLRTSHKSEPKLIGYDEIPIDVNLPDVDGIEKLSLQEPFDDQIEPKTNLISEMSETNSSSSVSRSQTGDQRSGRDSLPVVTGGLQRPSGSAKSRLYEICAANHWRPPQFECCKEEGPSHLKTFTYRVEVIMDPPGQILEGYSGPQLKKKAAEEHAAEGLLWYLKNEGWLD